jgi:hypothetical protein
VLFRSVLPAKGVSVDKRTSKEAEKAMRNSERP